MKFGAAGFIQPHLHNSPDHTTCHHHDCARCGEIGGGIETARRKGHGAFGLALVALPNGRLVSGSGDWTIRLSDTDSGAEIGRLEVDGGIAGLLTRTGD